MHLSQVVAACYVPRVEAGEVWAADAARPLVAVEEDTIAEGTRHGVAVLVARLLTMRGPRDEPGR